jgi:hypothetical protein
MNRRLLTTGLPIAVLALVIAAGAACAELVADIADLTPRQAQSYAEVMAELQNLHVTDRVHCVSIGQSGRGRTIAMARVCDPSLDPRALKKILVIARQHGNEPSGTEAMMALLRHMATTDGRAEKALMRRVALLIVPMANPDGADANRRRNGNNVDLNRDWVALSQPETRAIEATFLDWRPDAVMDLHELPAYSSKSAYQDNFVETIGSSNALPARLCDTTGRVSAQLSVWMGRYGFPLNVYYDTPGEDTRLCHRHFGLGHQTPSYLFESKTGRGRSLRDRAAYHILGTLVIANQLAYHDDGETTMVATAPTPPPATAAPEIAPVRVTLDEPVALEPDDKGVARTLMCAAVTGDEEFSYVTFEVNGTVVALTNQAPYEYAVDLGQHAAGTQQQLAVRCYDSSGRCLAGDTISVVAQPATAMGE